MNKDRDITATYRIAKETEGDLYEVKTFYKNPKPISLVILRIDAMPDWMQNVVRMLDAVGAECKIPLPEGGAAWLLEPKIYWVEVADSTETSNSDISITKTY